MIVPPSRPTACLSSFSDTPVPSTAVTLASIADQPEHLLPVYRITCLICVAADYSSLQLRLRPQRDPMLTGPLGLLCSSRVYRLSWANPRQVWEELGLEDLRSAIKALSGRETGSNSTPRRTWRWP